MTITLSESELEAIKEVSKNSGYKLGYDQAKVKIDLMTFYKGYREGWLDHKEEPKKDDVYKTAEDAMKHIRKYLDEKSSWGL